MNIHAQTAINALDNARGDDLERARHAFRSCTPEKMDGLYGYSGMTRRELLRHYEAHEAKIDAAIKWVREMGETHA